MSLDHPIINPLTKKYYKKSFIINFKTKDYFGTETFINENIIRASELIYLKKLDKGFYEKRLQRDKDNGFIHVDKFEDFLTEYDESRDIYKTIEDYYPTLLEKTKQAFADNQSSQ